MNVLKNILISVGVISIALFIMLLIVGVKVVSIILLYIVGIIAAISMVGFIIYYLGKLSGKRERE